MKKNLTTILLIVITCFYAFAQDKWIAPEVDAEIISQYTFDDDFILEGQISYDNYCTSCHGTPTENNYTRMVPPPGDPGEAVFQDQTDGSLFYKIKNGRALMPAFADVMSDDEIWSLVAYFRSFNENYEQPKFNPVGVEIPELTVQLEFDENIDKIVAKVTANDKPFSEAKVSAFIKASFGSFLMGHSETNDLGIAYFDLSGTIPPSKDGTLNFIVKVSKGYAYAKANERIQIGEAHIIPNLIEGKHLWSAQGKAPFWLKVAFYLATIGIWSVLIFILFGLLKLKKYNKNSSPSDIQKQ